MPADILRADWLRYCAGFATHAAGKSGDTTQVGVALFGPGCVIRMTGFNDLPPGVVDHPERRAAPTKYLYTSHAEENAVGYAARHGIALAGCDAVVTHHPCSRCARQFITAGIRRVWVGHGVTRMPPEEFEAAAIMFEEAGVEVRTMPRWV